jgi:hypothetical protein
MRKIQRFILVVVSIMALSLLLPATSHAAGPTWTVDSLNTIGCDSGNISFTTTVSGYTGGTERFRTIVEAGGLIYMDEDAGQPGSNGTYGWHLYASSSGGPTTGTWPLPPDTPITVHFRFIDGVGGPTVFETIVTLTKCNGGTIYSGSSASTALTYQGAPIPAGFVLRTITHDTAVYNTAGGTPLGADDAIKAGQTWFVSPTPKIVGGTSWTEIFTDGLIDGYIPSAYVGGKPSGYGGI